MPKTPPFIARTFRAFRYRDFRLMWMGACASTIGTFVQQFAQSWLVYDLTKNPFYLGLDLFLGQAPIMMFSLFGGVFADRLDRRKMMVTSQYIQMTCAFLLATLFATHVVQAHPDAVIHWGVGAIVWRAGLLGAVAGAGGAGGFVECDCDEFHPVQPGAGAGADYRGAGIHDVRRDVVLCPERALVCSGDRFSVRNHGEVCSLEVERVSSFQPERGSAVHPAAGRHERAGGACILHGAVRVLDEWLFAGVRAQCLSPRAGDLHAAAGVLGGGIDSRGTGRGGTGEAEGTRPLDAADPDSVGLCDGRLCDVAVAAAFVCADVSGRRGGDGVGVVHAFAGATACHGRDARPRDERLQPGVSRGNAGGSTAVRQVDSVAWRCKSPGRRRIGAGRGVTLFPDQGRKHIPRGQGCGVIGSGTFANGGLNKNMGPAAAARVIEPLCMLLCIPGFEKNDWMRALKMLRCCIGCRSLRLLMPIQCRDRDSYFATAARCACFF